MHFRPYYICLGLNTKGLDMNKAIISISVVLGLVCSTVIWPIAVQRAEKARRFLFARAHTKGYDFISDDEFTVSQLERFKKWMRTEAVD